MVNVKPTDCGEIRWFIYYLLETHRVMNVDGDCLETEGNANGYSDGWAGTDEPTYGCDRCVDNPL